MRHIVKLAILVALTGLLLSLVGCGVPPAEQIERDVLRGLPNGADIVGVLDIAQSRETFAYEQAKAAITKSSEIGAVYEKISDLTGLDPLKDLDKVAFSGYEMNTAMPSVLFLALGNFDASQVQERLRKVASRGNVETRTDSRTAYYEFVVNYRQWFVSLPSERIALVSNDEEYMKKAIGAFRKHGANAESDQGIGVLIAEIDTQVPLWVAGIAAGEADNPGAAKLPELGETLSLGAVFRGVRAYAVSIDFRRGFEISAWLESKSSDEAMNLKERLAACLARIQRETPKEAAFLTWIAHNVGITAYEQKVKLRLILSEADLEQHSGDIEQLRTAISNGRRSR
jgi:hypothetical protein